MMNILDINKGMINDNKENITAVNDPKYILDK
jgi:hypothetical protein